MLRLDNGCSSRFRYRFSLKQHHYTIRSFISAPLKSVLPSVLSESFSQIHFKSFGHRVSPNLRYSYIHQNIHLCSSESFFSIFEKFPEKHKLVAKVEIQVFMIYQGIPQFDNF